MAGRPKGSTNNPKLRDQLTPKQVTSLVNKAIEKAQEGDSIMLKFILEQIYGKALQPIGNDEGKALLIKFDNAFTSSSKTNSK